MYVYGFVSLAPVVFGRGLVVARRGGRHGDCELYLMIGIDEVGMEIENAFLLLLPLQQLAAAAQTNESGR